MRVKTSDLPYLGLYTPPSLQPRIAKKPRKQPVYRESAMQQQFIRWLKLQYPALKKSYFAVPNTAKRSAAEGARFKREGLTAGVCDFMMLIPNTKHHALLIEFKSPKGRVSPEQQEFLDTSNKNGYHAVVCRSLDEGMNIVKDYLAS